MGVGKNSMSQQPETTSLSQATHPATAPGSIPAPGAPPPPVPLGHHHEHRIPRWLVRAELLLRVMVRIYIGLAICYAPWSPTLWDRNPLFLAFPTLSILAANGAVRGIVTGLGLLNLWIAFQDAIRKQED